MENIMESFKVPSAFENSPGPRGLELLRIGMKFQTDALTAQSGLFNSYGDFVVCPWPNRFSVFFFSPTGAKHILKDNQTNYIKGREYSEMKPILGDGLLTSEGELWRRQRRTMAKEFHQARLDIYRETIEDEAHHLAQSWENESILDVTDGLTDYTFKVAGRIFFGNDLAEDSKATKVALDIETHRANKRMRRAFNLPRKFPTPENIKGEKAVKLLNGVVDKVLTKGIAEDNILARLSSFRDAEGAPMNPSLIRDEVMSLLLAGHETTSTGLMWTLYLLAQNPKWQDAIREDQTGLVAKACFLEALRIYPPIPVIARISIKDDIIDGHHIPANTSLVLTQWVTHRDERYWQDPLTFKPERFIDCNLKYAQDGTFFPFALGARACIGEAMAMLEAQVALEVLMKNFSFELCSGFIPKPNHHVTLRSGNGMLLSLKKRV
ncbi:MAG: hypothetical protein COW01_12945 [Bdellovibrionales bacterium CG12_big_fil_rev_8_21_14_0_65_38_15]|nr:MAG: hypothetical protein COW79_08675 [Bdellovibrionales bacterium CG22_combo_CG10-13_8_21_14_all_38_13]PIQ53530.1 MAG: hypothetical protein COW01_12945 [Bdellovibrionales bacterium CG12_big_fil_rev_8_21_14_0_65_38_15]PIR28466.1 MAG: hypothetical protein COV38_15695 [Bdellovibrionales bacterium CG11_big_fil_rev_8_21_14_0_20_38_13]